MNILWLDDELGRLVFELDELEDNGYSILTASSVNEALHLISENEIQLIISDLMLPPPDGVCFLQIAAELFPEHKFIVLSAFHSNDIYRNQLRSYSNRIVKMRKPICDHLLMEKVRQTYQYNSDKKKLSSNKESRVKNIINKLYDSSELKPGFLGLKIDIKKLFGNDI